MFYRCGITSLIFLIRHELPLVSLLHIAHIAHIAFFILYYFLHCFVSVDVLQLFWTYRWSHLHLIPEHVGRVGFVPVGLQVVLPLVLLHSF